MDKADQANKRYTHTWYLDDGIFAMRVEDFMDMFTQLVIVRDFPQSNFGIEYNPTWKV